jgi:hypothetical protein
MQSSLRPDSLSKKRDAKLSQGVEINGMSRFPRPSLVFLRFSQLETVTCYFLSSANQKDEVESLKP